MRILASDGMDKSAIAALKEMGHEVVEQFYEPEELAEQVKQYDIFGCAQRDQGTQAHN